MALQLKNPQFSKLTETPQRKTYTVAFATLILVVVMVFFAIRPAVISIFDRRSENETKREVLTKMDTKYKNLTSLNSQKQDHSQDLALLDSSLPGAGDEDYLLANVQQIVRADNVKFQSMSIEENVTKSVLDNSQLGVNTATSGFTLNVQGKRSAIINLINDLENFPRIINIYTVNFTDEGGPASNQGNYNAVIEAEFYYYNENVKNVD